MKVQNLENEEEEISSIKRQLLFNKYKILFEEIYPHKKEKNSLVKIIKNNGKENKKVKEKQIINNIKVFLLLIFLFIFSTNILIYIFINSLFLQFI